MVLGKNDSKTDGKQETLEILYFGNMSKMI